MADAFDTIDDEQPEAPSAEDTPEALADMPLPQAPLSSTPQMAPESPSGKLINVIDPDSPEEVGSIPASQLPDALNQGYRTASQGEVDKFFKKQKYGSTEQQVKTFAEGAAEGATFGLSTGLETGLGIATPEDIRARREENPYSHGAGQLTGIVGSSALGGLGAAGLLEGAGARAATALGLGGIEAGVASKIGAAAVKGAVENMLVQGGDEVSKIFSQDPDQTVGTAMTSIGLSGLIGGSIMGAVGTVSPLYKATIGRRLTPILDDIAGNVERAGANLAGHGEDVVNLPDSFWQEGILSDGVKQLKPNHPEVQAAASRIGAEVTPGTLSSSKLAQAVESELRKPRGTVGSYLMAKDTEALVNPVKAAARSTLRDATIKSEYEIGKSIENGITSRLESELAPIEAQEKKLAGYFKEMHLPENSTDMVVQDMMSDPIVRVAPKSKAARTARTIADELLGLKTVDDIEVYQGLLSRRISGASSEELPALQMAQQSLTALRDLGIENAVGADGRAISSKVINEIRGVNAAKSSYLEKLKSLGIESGLGKIEDARMLLDKLKKLPTETWAKRIFDTGDVNQLNFFKQNFPEEFELARRFKLKEIAQHATSNAQGANKDFNIGSFLNKVRESNLGPEAREMLFQGHGQTLKDIETLYGAMPGEFNAPNTAAALSIGKFLSLQGLGENLSDGVKYAILKSLPHINRASSQAESIGFLKFMGEADKGVKPEAFQAMVDFISHTIKGENLLAKATSGVFKAGREVIPGHLIPTEKSREKLDRRLQALNQRPDELFDVGGDTGHYMPGEGEAMAQTAASAVNYLNSLRPSVDKSSPFDSEVKVDAVKKAAYQDALEIAEQPAVVLNKVKEGTLTSQDMIHLNRLYPGLQQKMTEKLTSHMVDTLSKGGVVPYKTRIGLSLFMGQPLDSTLTPNSIRAAQPKTPSATPQSNPNAPQPGRSHSLKNIGKIANGVATPGQAREAQRSGRS